MSNRISLCVTILSLEETKKELLCRIEKHKNPLVCKYENEDILANIEIGKRIVLHGKLCSRDRCAWNPCECRTTHQEIESYLLVDKVTPMNQSHTNHVSLTGYVVSLPQQIQTLQHTFYSVRIKLSDNCGYATFTYTPVQKPKCPVVLGQEVLISGRLKVKDYEKLAICPCCQDTHFHPMLSVLVMTEDLIW